MRVSLKNLVIPSIPLAVFLVVSCFIIWMSAFVGARFSTYAILNTSLVNSLQSLFLPNSIFPNLVCISLTLLNAFLVAQINNRFTIIRTRTFLPILIFLILMSTWNQTHVMMGSLIGLTLFIFALFNFFTLSRDRKASEQAFMGSMLISMGSLLVNPLIFLIPVCWIGFMMFQSFSFRTFLASIFGVLIPWIIYLSVQYSLVPEFDITKQLNIYLNIDYTFATYALSEIIYAVALGIIMLISIIGMYSITNSDAINTRNKLNFLFLLLLSVIVLAILFRNQFASFLPFIALIYSILISHPLTLKQNNFYGILFVVFCLFNIAFVISKYFIF